MRTVRVGVRIWVVRTTRARGLLRVARGRRSITARRRDEVQSTERVVRSEMRDPGGPVEANGLGGGRRSGDRVAAWEVSDPVRGRLRGFPGRWW